MEPATTSGSAVAAAAAAAAVASMDADGAARPVRVIERGVRVVRGPDWDWGDQDGGPGSLGVIMDADAGGGQAHWARVRWDNSVENRYMVSPERGRFDLAHAPSGAPPAPFHNPISAARTPLARAFGDAQGNIVAPARFQHILVNEIFPNSHAKKETVSEETVAELPSRSVTAEDAALLQESDETCCICRDMFEAGDVLMALGCSGVSTELVTETLQPVQPLSRLGLCGAHS